MHLEDQLTGKKALQVRIGQMDQQHPE